MVKANEGSGKMAGIVVSTGKIKVYENLKYLCEFAGLGQEFCDTLWEDVVTDAGMYQELLYYMENHTFLDEVRQEGYSLSDVYVWQMDRFNLFHDEGKNSFQCNKERMVLKAFRTMIDMRLKPEEYVRKFKEGPGMDRIM